MPTNIVDVSDFTDPVTAPAAADALDETEVVATAQAVANRTRFLYDTLDLPLGQVAKFIPASAAISQANLAAQPGWSYQPGVDNAQTTSAGDDSNLVFDLSVYLRDGSTLNRVEAYVTPGAARAALLRMSLVVESKLSAAPPAAPVVTPLSETFDDGTANYQSIATTPADLAEPINTVGTGLSWSARVESGDNAGVATDACEGLLLVYTPAKVSPE